jgi:hypothetical protein
LSAISAENSLAAAQQFALHRMFRARHEHKGRLAAIAIRRVVVAMQCHLAAGGDGGQSGPAAGPVGSTTLDAGEADFAAVLEAKATRIDHGDDAAFALRLKQTIGGVGGARPADASTRSDAAHAESKALQRNAGGVITLLSAPLAPV